MDPFFGSVLASAVGNIAGGLLGGGSQRKANELARDEAAYNRQEMERYAKLGLTWRAEDVMNAYQKTGIHPLALLGTQGPTYTPVTTAFSGSSPMGEGLSRMGQDISRSIYASADRELRTEALNVQKQVLNDNAERGHLENQLLKLRIASEAARLGQISSPGVPGPGTSSAAAVGLPDTTRLHMGIPGVEASREPGAVADIGYARTNTGWAVIPSKGIKDQIEDMSWYPFAHFIRNSFLPTLQNNMQPPFEAPKGKWWFFHPLKQEYQLLDKSTYKEGGPIGSYPMWSPGAGGRR